MFIPFWFLQLYLILQLFAFNLCTSLFQQLTFNFYYIFDFSSGIFFFTIDNLLLIAFSFPLRKDPLRFLLVLVQYRLTLSFCLSEKFLSPSVLNNYHAWYSIQLQVFLFQNFIIHHVTSFCPAKFLKKNQLITLCGSLYTTLCFSLATFRILSNFFLFNYDISWSGSVWVLVLWDYLCFLYLNISFFLAVQKFFHHNSIKYIFDHLLSLISFGTHIT